MHSKNDSNLVKRASKASSQKSSQKLQNENQQIFQSFGVKVFRHQSFRQSNQMNQQREKNHSQPEPQHSDQNIIGENHQIVLEETYPQVEVYETYKQMCKDIEFIQMLGNPRYVIELFNQGYFYNQEFKEYLNGLKCFLENKELNILIKYPEGLYNLEKMLQKGFAQRMETENWRKRFVIKCLKLNQAIKKNTRSWKEKADFSTSK